MDSVAIIALDGPVASGKTAVGRLVARRLGYRFLDTGIMYRAMTWAALEARVDPKDGTALTRLAKKRNIEVVFADAGRASVLIDHRDVTAHLWEQTVEQNVSLVSQVAGVRRVLVLKQRQIAGMGPVVMAGRDIGTVVLPDAPVKVYLTASVAERARRRHQELQASGVHLPYAQVLEELTQRDRLDSERKVAPLRPAPDAKVIVTDGLSVEEVTERILELVGRR